MRSVALPLAVLASGVASLAEAVDIALEKCSSSDQETIAQGDGYSEVDIFPLDGCVAIEDSNLFEQVTLETGMYNKYTYTDDKCSTGKSDAVILAKSTGECDGTTDYSLVVDPFNGPEDLVSDVYTIVEGIHKGADNCDAASTDYTRYHTDDLGNCVNGKKLTGTTATDGVTTYTLTSFDGTPACTGEESPDKTFKIGDCNAEGSDSIKYYEYVAPTPSPTDEPTTAAPTDAPTAAPRVALEKCVNNEPISLGKAYSVVEIFALDTCVDVDDGNGGVTSWQYKLDAAVYKKLTYADADCTGTGTVTEELASEDSTVKCGDNSNGYTHNLVSDDFTDPMELVSADYTIVEALYEGANGCTGVEVTSYTRYHSDIVNGTCVDDKKVTYDNSTKKYTVIKYEAAANGDESCTTPTTAANDDVEFEIEKCLDSGSDSMMYYEYVAPTPAPTLAPTTTTEYAVFHECNDDDDLTENPKKLIVRALDTCQGSGSTFTKLVLDDASGEYNEYTHTKEACNDNPLPTPVTFSAKNGSCTEYTQVPVDTMDFEKPATADYPVAVLTYSGDNCATNGVVKSLDLYHSNFTTIGNCTNKVKLEVDGNDYNITKYTDEACQNGADLIAYEKDVCLNGTAPSSKLVVYSDEHGDHANGSGHVALSTFSLILIAAATLL